MKHFLHILTVIVIGLSLGGCMTSKKFAKQGLKLQEQGMHEEAASAYYFSLLRNPTNVDAKIGLKQSGQQVLTNRLQVFNMARMSMTPKQAVYAYIDAEEYVTKIQAVGVTLDIPEIYKTDFAETKNTYCEELYDQGTTLLEEENFLGAEEVFAEIHFLDPEYGDVSELKHFARIEPKYRTAVEAFESEKFRKAYYAFKEVTNIEPTYKDAADQRDKALQMGQFALAVLPLKDGANDAGATVAAHAYVLQSLTNIDDPFLKVVDRDNINQVIEEQHLQLSGVMDENTAVEVGNLLGAKAIITGTLLGKSTTKGNLSSQNKVGYIQKKIKKYNKEEDKYYYVTEYKKTTYREYYNANEAYVSIQYKVISLVTGEVLASEIIQKKVEDKVHYATFDGDASKLYPSSGDAVNTSKSKKKELARLLASSRNIRSVDELAQDTYQLASKEISRDVEGLLQQIVQ